MIGTTVVGVLHMIHSGRKEFQYNTQVFGTQIDLVRNWTLSRKILLFTNDSNEEDDQSSFGKYMKLTTKGQK